MFKSYSISEAQRNLIQLVQQLEVHAQIELTYQGQPVAMLLSLAEYNYLMAKAQNFWDAYTAFAAIVDLPRLKLDPQVFETVRDRTSG